MTDARLDPDRRAWHRARAAEGPDEAAAGELEQSAERAQGRGGLSAAAAFLQRAAELTPDPALRVKRSLAAAQAKLDVADTLSASDLLAAAELGPVDELQRARLERLRAQIAFTSRRGRDAPPLLLEAARRLDPLDAAMARETYLEAMASAMFAGRLGAGPDVHAVAEAARGSDPAPAPGAAGLLLDALVTRFTEGYAAGVAPLSRALRAFGEPGDGGADRRWLWLACRLAQDLRDDELWYLLATRGVRVARETGALSLLPNALNYLAALNVHSGAFGAAAELIAEVDSITQATGIPPLRYAASTLLVARGDQAQALSLLEWGWRNVTERGEGSALGLASWLHAWLHNSHGHYGEALAAARRACEHEDVMAYGWALAELIEAAVRDGQPAEVYGEWLRRENRRVDAREQLRAAHEMFSRMGAEAFAERARRELSATGETVRKRTAETLDELTTQEAQVARLAAQGRTNPEIGAELFISPRTVEYHLHKVFSKLGINSRKELRRAFPDAEDAAVPA